MTSIGLLSPEEVFARLKVHLGEMPPGRILPSERQLANQLNVTRNAVRNALARLEETGFISRRSKRMRIVSWQPNAQMPAVAKQPITLIKTIGIFVAPDFRYVPQAKKEGGWAQNIYHGIIDGVFEAGLSAFMVSSQQTDSAFFADAAPAGIILASPIGIPSLAELRARLSLADIPVAVYGDTLPWPDCDMVFSDHESGAFQVAAWLMQKGCRRLLRLHSTSALGQPWLDQRDRGFVRACEKYGLPVLPPDFLVGLPNAEESAETFRASAHMMAGVLYRHFQGEQAVDGLVLISDGSIPTVMAACRILGRTPGKDVLIAGYDNYWLDCPGRRFENTPPNLSVDKSNYQIGRALAALIHERVSGTAPAEPMRKRIAPRLVFFESDKKGE